MNKKHTPIAALTNVAELHETYARRADRQERFAMQVQAAFPSLWQHTALGGNDTERTVA